MSQQVTPLGNLSIGDKSVPIVLTDFVSALAKRRMKDRLRAADWRGMSAEDIAANATGILWQELFIAGAGLIADCPETLDTWRADTLSDFVAAVNNDPPFPRSVMLPVPETLLMENNP